jgi:hypothetical protein
VKIFPRGCEVTDAAPRILTVFIFLILFLIVFLRGDRDRQTTIHPLDLRGVDRRKFSGIGAG